VREGRKDVFLIEVRPCKISVDERNRYGRASGKKMIQTGLQSLIGAVGFSRAEGCTDLSHFAPLCAFK
tara:strand:- start:393 stop:596 length:204 start_codon:yes stop_codon:yes gene_type:complete